MTIDKAVTLAMDKYGYINSKVLKNEFGISNWCIHINGGIKKICEKYGCNYLFGNRSDPNDVLNDIRNVYDNIGHIDLMTYLEFGKYSKQSIKTACGSFNNALKTLGIDLNMSRFEDEQNVIKDIESVCNVYGCSSTKYRKYGKYSQSVIERIWGSWENAISTIGLKPINKKYGKDKMSEFIKDVYDKYGMLSKTLIDNCCPFTYQAAYSSFGGKHGICSIVNDYSAFDKSVSSGHIALKKILTELYPNCAIEEEKTFDWLRNPATNKSMYIDFYIPKYRLCIEYDGEQHFKKVKYFYKTDDDYINAVNRDKAKNHILFEHGYKLVRIRYDTQLSCDNIKTMINMTTM